MKTRSQRPYLLRAMHEWISDNSLTPHIVVNAEADSWGVPRQYISNGKLVLNISYEATQNLDISTDRLSFEARFRGISQHIDVPSSAIIRIYAQETGVGMTFAEVELTPPDPDKPPKRPTLKVV